MMARLYLLIFFISTIFQSLTNASSADSSEVESSSQKLDSPIFQVSPIDIENSTGPFLRSDSGLNRLLSLSNPPNLPIDSDLNKDALSIDNLANQIGVTVSEQNLLGNFNNLNTDTSGQVIDTQVLGKSNVADLSSQSLNDYLNSNALLTQNNNNYQFSSNLVNTGNSQDQYGYSLAKAYPEITITETVNTNPTLIQGQGLPNNLFQQGTVFTDANEQLLKSIQSVLNQKDASTFNVYQTPTQYQAFVKDDPFLNVVFGQDQQTDAVNQNLGSLFENSASNQLLDIDSLLGQNSDFNTNEVLNVNPAAVQGKDTSASQYLKTNLQSLLGQDVDLEKLLQAEQENQYGSLTNNNLETRLVFREQVPNLHMPTCKAAFGALVNNALLQYLKLTQLPFCLGGGSNTYPTTNLPFDIVVVPSGTSGQSNTNPALLKILLLLLNKLKNQAVSSSPNQDQSLVPILIELLNNVVQPPNNVPGNLSPSSNTNPNLPTLLLLLKLLGNQKPNPSQQYLTNVIIRVIKQKYPNFAPSGELPYEDSGPTRMPIYPELPIVPSAMPIYPELPIGPTSLPDGYPPLYPAVLNPSVSEAEPIFAPQSPAHPGFPTPSNQIIYPTNPTTAIDQIIPTGIVPTDFPDSSVLSNPSVKYLLLIFQKYLPQKNLSVQDILYLIQLMNSLPKTYGELLQNPALLQQATLQLANRNLDAQLVIALLYKYLIPFLNQNQLPGLNSDRVVVLKYQVKRQTPYIYQPYYYVQYELPYSNFVKNLQQLLIANPYLKQNRELLLKELLISAMSNNYDMSADLNGVSKEYLINSIANEGTKPLDVKVVNGNMAYEQLKVLNDLNAQLTSASTVTQTRKDDDILGGGQGDSGSNLVYVLQQPSSGLINANLGDLTTVNPFYQYLRRFENAGKNILQANDKYFEAQEVTTSADVKKKY